MKITDKHKANLKDRILENETDASNEFFETVVQIFERIPESDGETILKKNFYLVIPFSNTVYKRKISHGECWLVFLQSDLWDQKKKDDEILYTIAHGLAHLFFEHDGGGRAYEQEKEADIKVIEWGFEKELRATPHNYLFGSGHLLKIFGEVTLVKHNENGENMINEAAGMNIIEWYNALENQLIDFFKYVPPQSQNMRTWSPRLSTLVVESCGLIDSLLRYISPPKVQLHGKEKRREKLELPDFAGLYSIDRQLPNRKVILLISPPEYRTPFGVWLNSLEAPSWWTANNHLKHNRIDCFTEANLETAINALAGSLVIIATTPQLIPVLVRKGYLDLSGRHASSTIKNLQNYYGEVITLETSLFAMSFSNDPLPDNIHEFDPQLYGGSTRLKAFFVRSVCMGAD